MSNTSYSFKENSHVIDNQGGEKKVMKKILSVALSTAMAFSMFASVAFGADTNLTPQQKFDVLKQASIMDGMPDGSSALEKTLTRAELAKIIVKSIGLEEVNATSYNDKNYSIHWARTFIEAATQAGILEGTDATKKLFNPSGNVTVQELAAVLVRALKLEVPTETNNNASEWAKGYVEAAIKEGFLDSSANFTANATRSQAIVAAYAIYEAAQVPTVKSYEVKDSKNVEFTLSNDEVVKVTLETALEANKETEVTFKTAAGEEITAKITWVVTTANKVESVSADNLKEVVVTFDGEVDKATAELKDNYKLSGDRTVKSAVLSDSKNSVVLTLDDGKELTNQVKYTLTVTGVKAGTKTIEAKDVQFAPVDNKIPTVESVTSLGTKAVKVVFSEPIKSALTGSFQLDGKAFYGQPKIDNRVVILKAFDSSVLSAGEHTITVAGVEDFAKFKSLQSEHKFTVVEDSTAPTITEATATLEKLTVTFSEDVDGDTVNKDNVYWKSGDTKVKSTGFKALAGDKYEFYFEGGVGKNLPSYETTVYVEGIKDYSGNEIKETTKLVRATVDYERPFVVSVKATDAKPKEFVITFNKNIKASDWKNNIKVLDKDGKVQYVVSANVGPEKNQITVVLFNNLPQGTNTVTVQGIKDATVLENSSLDFTTEIKVGDTTGPKVSTAAFNINSELRRVIVVFDEAIDTETLVNRGNYILLFGTGPSYTQVAVPASAGITPIEGSKAVMIDLPEEVSGLKVFDGGSKLTGIKVLGIRDVAGNYLKNFSTDVIAANYTKATVVDYGNEDTIKNQAALTGTKEIKIRLNQGVSSASLGNVTVVSTLPSNPVTAKVTEISTNSNSDIITLKLDTDVYSTQGLEINFAGSDTKFTTVAGNTISIDPVTLNVGLKDEVAPTLVDGQNTYKTTTVTAGVYEVTIDFNEVLNDDIPANLLAQDLIVNRLEDPKNVPFKVGTTNADLNFEVAYSADYKSIIVTITDTKILNGQSKFSIEIINNARYIQDKATNVVKHVDPKRTNN